MHPPARRRSKSPVLPPALASQLAAGSIDKDQCPEYPQPQGQRSPASPDTSSQNKDAFMEEDEPWTTCASCWGLSSQPVIASAGASRAFPPALAWLAPAPSKEDDRELLDPAWGAAGIRCVGSLGHPPGQAMSRHVCH